MSDNNQAMQKGWSSVQVYLLSAICLLVGVTVGYLYRGSTAPASPGMPASTQTQASQGNPAGALPSNPSQPSQMDMKRMADKQVAPLLEQLKKNPKDTATLNKVAHYYMVAKQFKDAATYYQKAVDIKPSAQAWTQLSVAEYYGGSGEKAIEELNRALKLDPKYADALFNLGMLRWEVRNDTQGAIACWEKLLKENPNHPRRAEVEKMIARVKEHEKMPAGSKTDKPAM